MKLIRWVEVHIGRRKHKRDELPAIRKTEATPPDTPRLHIRTTLLDSPLARRESPRPRCRIRTNPWLPSPKSTASVGSASSESISGFGSRSSGSLWDGESCSTPRRVTLESRDEDTPYCPAHFCRPIPRTTWIDFREEKREDSSDEAYSEDYVHDEKDLSLDVIRTPKTPESPQADSACGSDHSSSSTPLSEAGCGEVLPEELLEDKVARLQRSRRCVDRRLAEARSEEVARREEQLLLQREMVQFRRLFLIQTLAELRHQLERKEGE